MDPGCPLLSELEITNSQGSAVDTSSMRGSPGPTAHEHKDPYQRSASPLPAFVLSIFSSHDRYISLSLFPLPQFFILFAPHPDPVSLSLYSPTRMWNRSTSFLPALTLVPVSSPTSCHPATLSWIPHSTTPLDSPSDLLTLSQPPSLQPQPPHLYDLAKEMNPADSATFHHILVGQGALLKQHDQALKILLEHMKEFSQSLSDLQGRPLSQSSQPVPSPSPPLREPFVPTPEHYDGNLRACRAFLVQCSLVFEQQCYPYASERANISFLIGCLCGAALCWAKVVWERQSPICFSYSRFTEEIKKVFDHLFSGKDAAKRLLSLRQEPHSVAEMACEFRTLAVESGWNEGALQGAIRNALTETLKDELVSRDEPDGLDKLNSLTIRIDNRLRERRRERVGRVACPITSASVPCPPSPTAPHPQAHQILNP
ncbi:unnamed protein product [Coregonus sp. 'balchen']|nr:unnamed protein product [Coregonus sp. 'balchen']